MAQGAACLLRKYGSPENALAAGRFAAQAEKLRLYRLIATMDRAGALLLPRGPEADMERGRGARPATGSSISSPSASKAWRLRKPHNRDLTRPWLAFQMPSQLARTSGGTRAASGATVCGASLVVTHRAHPVIDLGHVRDLLHRVLPTGARPLYSTSMPGPPLAEDMISAPKFLPAPSLSSFSGGSRAWGAPCRPARGIGAEGIKVTVHESVDTVVEGPERLCPVGL